MLPYTKAGDKGDTGLIGRRVRKSNLRVQAYGDVDELNSTIGYAISQVKNPKIPAVLENVQNDLFVVGADLAVPHDIELKKPLRLENSRVMYLENQIKEFTAELIPIRKFVLPGGVSGAAQLHVARTVCRRTERSVVSLSEQEQIGESVIPYLNRLSSLLFVLARAENQYNGYVEKTWGREGMLGI